MIIHVTVRDDDGTVRKDESFKDPIDMIAWVCRCYQATRRAHGYMKATAAILGMTAEGGVS